VSMEILSWQFLFRRRPLMRHPETFHRLQKNADATPHSAEVSFSGPNLVKRRRAESVGFSPPFS
jgi:hypothetical protein